MNFHTFYLWFFFPYLSVQACTVERFTEIFFDDIQRAARDGNIAEAMAKAKKALLFDPHLCVKNKICRFRKELVEHLASIAEAESFEDELAEFPMYYTTEECEADWLVFSRLKLEGVSAQTKNGKYMQPEDRVKAAAQEGAEFIRNCPSFFLKMYFESGECRTDFYERNFLDEYQRDIRKGRTNRAIARAKASEPLWLLNTSNYIVNKRFRRITLLKKLIPGEMLTSDSAENPRFETVQEAQKAWREFLTATASNKRLIAERAYERQMKIFNHQIIHSNARDRTNSLMEELTTKNDDYAQLSYRRTELKMDAIMKFIEQCPHFFLKKMHNEQDPYGEEIGPTFLGDGECITFYDDFEHDHGPEVVSIACDSDFGLAKYVDHEDLSSGFFGSLYTANGPQDYSDSERSSMESFFADAHELQSLPLSTSDINLTLERGVAYYNNLYHVFNYIEEHQIPLGSIVNCSFGHDLEEMAAQNIDDILSNLYFISLLLQVNVLLVFAAGNASLNMSSLSRTSERVLYFSNFKTGGGLINVVALNEDGLSLAEFTQQSGSDPRIFKQTICAPGVNRKVRKLNGDVHFESGTSLAAPFVAAVAAIVRSNISDPQNNIITRCILEQATPIVMRQSRKRMFDIPVALIDVTAKGLTPGKYHYIPSGKFEPKEIIVDQPMIDEGVKRYGRGRIHMRRTLQAAIEEHRKIGIDPKTVSESPVRSPA